VPLLKGGVPSHLVGTVYVLHTRKNSSCIREMYKMYKSRTSLVAYVVVVLFLQTLAYKPFGIFVMN
jgi:hypothetical protein